MRRILTGIGLLAIVGSIFFVAFTGDDASERAAAPTPRPGVEGLDAGSHGSKRPPMPPIDLSLTARDGKRVTERGLIGNPSVFAFVPRRCDGECPAMLDQVRGALDRLGDSGSHVQVVIVPTSLPSERDTARLADRRGIGEHAIVAAGPAGGLRRTLDEFELSLGPSGRLLAYLVVVDSRLRQRIAYVTHTLTPEALAADLKSLLATASR